MRKIKRRTRYGLGALAAATILSGTLLGCNLQAGESQPRMTMFVGVDASGSFHRSGYYDNALSFLAHYIYGHMHGLGKLEVPRELFVGSVGGKSRNEPKSFHPIHDFQGKDIAQIEANLRDWFPPTDTFTDFNAYFGQVARIAKERNLILAPITIMIITDGVPDTSVRGVKAGSKDLYTKIDLDPLEYLSRNLTIRVTYVSPKVGEHWRTLVPRQRVRLWTQDAAVMKGWQDQMKSGIEPAGQHKLWEWVKDNVDFRVRARKI